jgi:UTP--glucose-1-phosphate uridylyltransferase
MNAKMFKPSIITSNYNGGIMRNSDVKFAVIPCAGHGTRFLPITKGVPKEMCPIVDRPTLDYIVQECIDSGVTDIVLVVSKGKGDIRRYYQSNPVYEAELRAAGKDKYADMIHEVAHKARFHYVTQHELLGLGHAVLQAKDIVKDNNFLVCCGDDICTYKDEAPAKQMIDAFKQVGGYAVVGGQKVAHDAINKYGCMDVKNKLGERLYELHGIIEKPDIDKAPSDLASLGKWVLPGKIFDILEKTPRGRGNEIQLTDAIALLLKEEPVFYYDFVGKRYDCGDKLGYLTAIVDIALSRDDLKDGLKEHIKSLNIK